MSVDHKIDKENKLILTSFVGEPTDSEMVDAYNSYYREIKCKPEYEDFNEIVDFTDATGSSITLAGIKEILRIAIKYDLETKKTKLAFVASSKRIFNMALVYATYRDILYRSNKQVKVFKKLTDAYKWL